MKHKDIIWNNNVDIHDYSAAESYLSLVYQKEKVDDIISKLKTSNITQFKAKDIFRSSKLSLLGVSNSHVKKDKINIKNGEKMSPILLVRDPDDSKVIIADGYHRLCAIYSFNEDAWIQCKIV